MSFLTSFPYVPAVDDSVRLVYNGKYSEIIAGKVVEVKNDVMRVKYDRETETMKGRGFGCYTLANVRFING